MDRRRPKTAEAGQSSSHDKAKSSHPRSASSEDLPASKKNHSSLALRSESRHGNKHKQRQSDNAPSQGKVLDVIPLQTTSVSTAVKVGPVPVPSASAPVPATPFQPTPPPSKPWFTYIYDKQTKQFCGRTLLEWVYIIGYAIIYLIFLSTYTMIFLYASLRLVKVSEDYKLSDKDDLYTFKEQGVGLSAAPTSEHGYPLIWFRSGDKKDYEKYIDSLNILLNAEESNGPAGNNSRRKREVSDLGPCGAPPYGYGDSPCIILRLNKQLAWAGRPLQPGSELAKTAPDRVKNWLKLEKQKLWLYCGGYYHWDEEHIGKIQYYPDPPGFDPDLFPLSNMSSSSPLVAIQLSSFTKGISLAVECKLWYNEGPSSFHFVLYVEPKEQTVQKP